MDWEDGTISQIEVLIETAESLIKDGLKPEAQRKLKQALASAKILKDEYKRQCLVRLIEDKLSDF